MSLGPAPFMSPAGTQLSTSITAGSLPIMAKASNVQAYFSSLSAPVSVPAANLVPIGANQNVGSVYYSTIGPVASVNTGNRVLPMITAVNQNGSYYTK